MAFGVGSDGAEDSATVVGPYIARERERDQKTKAAALRCLPLRPPFLTKRTWIVKGEDLYLYL